MRRPLAAGLAPNSPTSSPRNRLRILCLHGFRQNGTKFRGRAAALARRLADLAELVFIDGPHCLPFYYKEGSSCPDPVASSTLQIIQNLDRDGTAQAGVSDASAFAGCKGESDDHESSETRPCCREQARSWRTTPSTAGIRPKRAWLVEPGQKLLAHTLRPLSSNGQEPNGDLGSPLDKAAERGLPGAETAVWEPFPASMGTGQHIQQTDGWDASAEILRTAFRELGPFDGIFGFSQVINLGGQDI